MPADYTIGFQITPQTGMLTLYCEGNPDLLLQDSQCTVVIVEQGRQIRLPVNRLEPAELPSHNAESEHMPGFAPVQSFDWVNSENGLQGTLEFAGSRDGVLVACRIHLRNQSAATRVIRRIELLQAGSLADGGSTIRFSGSDRTADMAFLVNGWQSWSYSGVYGAQQRQRRSALRFIPNAISANLDTPDLRTKGRFSGDMFGVFGNRRSRTGLLGGFVSQKQNFGSLEADLRATPGLRIWANGDDTQMPPGAAMTTDWLVFAWLDLDKPQCLQRYFELAAEVNLARSAGKPIRGWCSWYQYDTHINSALIQGNTKALTDLRQRLPLELVQIDDGFQSAGGDWFQFQPGFSGGLASLAQSIRKDHMTPGLWLAPFIASRGARLLADHPEYILRKRSGAPVNAGFISGKFSAALDVSYPPVLDYACQVIETAVREWGFPYLKLDFLYAGALPGKRFIPTFTRAQILRHALEQVRCAAGPETFLLGCGVPLGSGLGIFDGMRIGADTAGSWRPKLFNIPLLFRNDPQLPSARNAIQNIITRSGMHSTWWANDPDCLLVRPETDLTLDEVRSHATLIAMSGGSLLLSDDLARLPEQRRRTAEVLLPLIGKKPQVMDWFDRLTPRCLRLDLEGSCGVWHLLAYFNGSDRLEHTLLSLRQFGLEDGAYIACSFWDGQMRTTADTGDLWSADLPAHACLLLAVRRLQVSPQYIGSDVHVSQGLEVCGWHVEPSRISCQVKLGREARGMLYIRIPAGFVQAEWNGQLYQAELQDGVFRFPIDTGSGCLTIILA